MNPPFTRNTTNEGEHANKFNAAFAAFNTSDADQRAMGKRMAELKKDTCYHGNAGIASAFAALAHRTLKPGGVMALVLPLSATTGSSWQRFREMLVRNYSDLMVLSIAANGADMSFSSDTGMAECLVVAKKKSHEGRDRFTPESASIKFISLKRRPQGFAYANEAAKSIMDARSVRGIDDGPYGGTPLMVGDDLIGAVMSASCSVSGDLWGGVRMSDYSLAQVGYALANSSLWLPGIRSAVGLKMALLGAVGKIGLHHRDITGPPPRGPFDRMECSPTATYPALWNHNAKKETRMICQPDSQLIVRQGMEGKAATAWSAASRAHLNTEFTFGSQALAVALTERESIGGWVWPNVIFDDKGFDCAFAIWCNSTLGMLSHWWHSSRQQSSKARISLRSTESLRVLDFRVLSDEQLGTAEAIFEEFRDRELKPAYLADADPNRALLDRRVVCDLLGFDQATYEAVRQLAAKWCAEPSVHGGKKRPRGARLVL